MDKMKTVLNKEGIVGFSGGYCVHGSFGVYPHTHSVTVYPLVNSGEYRDEKGNILSATELRSLGLTLEAVGKDCTVKDLHKI